MKTTKKYYVRVRDINDKEGMSVAVAALYFHDAFKDSGFKGTINSIKVDVLQHLDEPLNISIDTSVDGDVALQTLSLSGVLMYKAKSVIVP